MLTSRSQLLKTLGRGYARAIRQTLLGGATGHFARSHLDIVCENLHGRNHAFPNTGLFISQWNILKIYNK
jgi:hypothetical protein